MSQALPLVTVLIATKDRPDDLRRTLQEVRRQDYPVLEMLIIDDGSRANLRTIVDEEWPDARFIRNENSAGQSQRRTEGFVLARGEYILQLDDDSAPVDPSALRTAVSLMMARPEIGILSLHIFNGPVLPAERPRAEPKYCVAFVGCGALCRTVAVQEQKGYLAFLQNEWEEDELSLRVLKAGWALYFSPEVLIHHHVSPQNRRSARTWMRGFRNKLWAHVMHYRLQRAVLEGAWVIGLACWDAVRLFRPHYLLLGLTQFAAGLPRAMRLREPMSPDVLVRYDALRFRTVRTEEEFQNPKGLNWKDLCSWFQAWRNRPRQRSVWDRREGDIGRSETVAFAHEYRTDTPKGTRNRE